MVSVLCPTSARRHWAHPLLYHSFTTQTHPRKELLVFDTDGERSPFFDQLDDPRVSYFHVALAPELGTDLSFATGRPARDPAPELTARWPALRGDPSLIRAASGAMSIGEKRNWLSLRASGTLLANFDDDDYYLPSYLERMCSTLRAYAADLVKLGSWMLFDAKMDVLSYFDDVGQWAGGTSRAHAGVRWGFGFSYVYTAQLAREVHYPPISMGEDFDFVLEAARNGRACLAFSDAVGNAAVCHVTHGKNTSNAHSNQALAMGGIGGTEKLQSVLGPLHGQEARSVLDAIVAAHRLPAADAARRSLQERLAVVQSEYSYPAPVHFAQGGACVQHDAAELSGRNSTLGRATASSATATIALTTLLGKLRGGSGVESAARLQPRPTREDLSPEARVALVRLLKGDRAQVHGALKSLGVDKLGQRLSLINGLIELAGR